ncbi:MAG: hypothetical protein GTN49_06030 [candidate division Zixibacteria bacterium]|nr:hypothetical protein [candidate division Zixibacteria bacterium]
MKVPGYAASYRSLFAPGYLRPCPFCQEGEGSALADSLDEAIEDIKSRGCHVFETNAWV